MAFTFTATAQPNTTPPSVLLSVTRTSGTTSTIHMDRIDADGVSREVRTATGSSLDVSSGSATVTDNEYRYGTSVTYRVREEPGTSQDFSMEVDVPWLTHIGVPSRSRPVDFRIGTNDEEEWGLEQGVFDVLNRTTPIVVTGGARQAPVSSLTLSITSVAEKSAIRDLLSDGSALLLNVPTSLGLGLDSAYIAIGSASVSRPSSVGTEALWDIKLPYRVVSRPQSGTRAGYAWADVAASYGTWASIPAGTTWADLAAAGG